MNSAITSRIVERVLLLSSGSRPEMAAEAQRLLPLVAQFAQVEYVDLDRVASLENVAFDLAVVVGGDGSILRAAHHMGRRQRPVVAINLGKLGFLADLSPDEFLAQLPAICSCSLPVVEHLMLDCRLFRGGNEICQQLGLNEVVVFAGPPFSILQIDLYVDAELVTTYSCDGLIVSTPVGSTAHSLSAGGPILRKDLQAFVVLPISPHTLTNRPVVDSADRMFELVVPAPNAGTSLVCDGKTLARLEAGDRIRVQRADVGFGLVTVPGHSYYRTLRDKLGWGGIIHLNHDKRSPSG
jgi:NAD+ kinase